MGCVVGAVGVMLLVGLFVWIARTRRRDRRAPVVSLEAANSLESSESAWAELSEGGFGDGSPLVAVVADGRPRRERDDSRDAASFTSSFDAAPVVAPDAAQSAAMARQAAMQLHFMHGAVKLNSSFSASMREDTESSL